MRERAVRMVAEVMPDYPSQWAAIEAVAARLGVGTAETLRKVGAPGGGRRRAAARSDERGERRDQAAQREVAELRRANEILKAASIFFAAEPGRPHPRS